MQTGTKFNKSEGASNHNSTCSFTPDYKFTISYDGLTDRRVVQWKTKYKTSIKSVSYTHLDVYKRQVHRITDTIEKALEKKLICSTIFLDVAQAFDKVWHKGLIHKLNKMLPKQYADVLKSYISERLFRVKQEDDYSELREVRAGVPQGSVLGPILYLLFTCDLPQPENVTVATFADDTAIMAIGSTLGEATNMLQDASDQIQQWTGKWKIKLNELKSVHINFTNKRIENSLPVTLNGVVVPCANTAKYLGMTLDTKLRWKEHIRKKGRSLVSNIDNCIGSWDEILSCQYTTKF